MISKSPCAPMAKMQVNVEMDDLTKEDDHPTVKFLQPNRKGWSGYSAYLLIPFPSGHKPALRYFFLLACTSKK